MTLPGKVLDRTVKHGRVTFAIDPSIEMFLSRSKGSRDTVSIVIGPGNLTRMDPIVVEAKVRKCILQVEDAVVERGRLQDLEYLIQDEDADVTLAIGYTPESDLLDGVQTVTIGGDTASTEDPSGEPDEVGSSSNGAETFAEDPPRSDDPQKRQEIKFKCSGMKKAGFDATITPVMGTNEVLLRWKAQMGNWNHEDNEGLPFKSNLDALTVLRMDLLRWLDEIEITGDADFKQANESRRDQMRDQVTAKLDELIQAAGGDPEPTTDNQ